LILLGIVGFFFIARYFNVNTYLTLENIRYHADVIASFIERRYWTSVFIFWCLYVFENVFALPLAASLTVAAGYFYGVLPAIVFTIVAATSGAIVLFYMARYLFGNGLQKKYAERLNGFNRAFKEQGAYYLLSVRLTPIIPFVVVNIFAGLTLVPVSTFIWTTALGMIPVTIVYACAGQQLQSIVSVGDIFTLRILVILAILAFIALLPVVVQHYRNNRNTSRKK
jgi:uncharacterized membrane protein YdjX (TVP38/TMEM64 family)